MTCVTVRDIRARIKRRIAFTGGIGITKGDIVDLSRWRGIDLVLHLPVIEPERTSARNVTTFHRDNIRTRRRGTWNFDLERPPATIRAGSARYTELARCSRKVDGHVLGRRESKARLIRCDGYRVAGGPLRWTNSYRA